MTKIVLIGEAWGEYEDMIQSAFVGSSGIELMKMLDQAGIMKLTAEDNHFIRKFWRDRDPVYTDNVWKLHPEIFRTNVFNLRPKANKIENLCGEKHWGIPGFPALAKGKYVKRDLSPQLDRLADELEFQNPNLVVALGNTPTWALLGQTSITKVRGTTQLSTHTIRGFKVLPTYHPAAIMYQWSLRPIAVIDLQKAKREAEFPEIRRPKRRIFIPEIVEDLYAFEQQYIRRDGRLSVDIETAGNQITSISFAPSPDVSLVIPIFHRSRVGRSYWTSYESEVAAVAFIARILGGETRKTFQNGLFDIAFLWRCYGIKVMNADEDTMLLHHAIQPESLKGLGFLGSIYTDEGNWKRMRDVDTIKQDD